MYLKPPELIRYGTCSRLAFARVADAVSYLYSTRRLLQKFFPTDDDYSRFRQTQKTHGVLVSGSQVTGLFVRNTVPFVTSDLDLYVNIEGEDFLATTLAEIGYHLYIDLSRQQIDQSDDYELISAMQNHEIILHAKYVCSAIASVKEYRNRDGKIVQVIASHGPPMDIILCFHSTCVMNVISYHYAYCLYPSATICDRVSVAHFGDDINSSCARQKWAARGWRIATEATSSPRLDLRTIHRYVGDRHSWRICCEDRLTVADVLNENSRTTDVLSAHSWQLLYSRQFDEGFYAIYAWFLLPHFHQYICISNKIMRCLKTCMLTWYVMF
ncbi:hypothetical protein IW261DRAFT_1344459 [Armillaria novae-zelandiae]|uniref:Uncharacterized protein n=1 Tax=Armillaria novae-zelandiae TaxID=153914 RepID=A0AA39TVT0_9AGAR|nr:hypothetical protein IW261DRAFT_1344459 [Armillaria novae-zelandiae]